MNAIEGVVAHGKHLGRTLGFPTANLETEAWPDISGVWAAQTTVDGVEYPVMLNVGCHPTLPEGKPTVEAHLIGFSGDLYGRRLTVRPLPLLRDEARFASREELTAQLKRDCETIIAQSEELRVESGVKVT